MAVSEKTREADEKLREELRHADIGKLKRLMAPLIEKTAASTKKPHRKRKSVGRREP